MRIVCQNVLNASVTIENKLYSEIEKGYLLLVSFTKTDTKEICDKMLKKLVNMRVFQDENGKTNLSINDVNGAILSVSQFTLYGDLRKGNRPSFIDKCMDPQTAKGLYEYFNNELKKTGLIIKEGVFGADMKVSLINDGPFTVILDSEELF